MIYFCCDQLRRNAVRGSSLNGIDFLEVLDSDALSPADRQRTLFIHFVNDLSGPPLGVDNIRIEGGERITDISVEAVTPGSEANVLTVEVDRPGDFSLYTLRLVQDALHPQPPDGIDPMLAAVAFSFKVECPQDFDCEPQRVCPPEVLRDPRLDYLAKDYASFRRLMLDRMAVLAPGWRERNPADVGVTLVELLAYAGDHLSYQQDAVATEAYLGTARRRTSVRRHARLMDYFVSDGCNARAWVHLEVSADTSETLPAGTRLFTRIGGEPVTLPDEAQIYSRAREAFETIAPLSGLFMAHNRILLYTWGDQRCCLPRGATRATLQGHLPDLTPGDVLIFEEVTGPRTGRPEDADPSRRHAVRLTLVTQFDAASDPLEDPLGGELITEIQWAAADALPFPMCLSAQTDDDVYIEDVSVARGNIVPADHGLTIAEELASAVPEPTLFRPAVAGADPCEPPDRPPAYPRFRPLLQRGLLTHAAPFDPELSAAGGMRWSLRSVVPAITLETLETVPTTWRPQRDLLNSAADATEFVVEIESDGSATLRFGDDEHGARPEPGTRFTATYRVGNGAAGNIGAEALGHIITTIPVITGVRNPLPARGGSDPESIEDVRQYAPSAFRTQERAVTPEDYAEVAGRVPGVQRAAATFRWTGSWHTVFLTADRTAGVSLDEDFESAMRGHVERYRMAGYDLEVDTPRFVPLEIEMDVCVAPEYFRSDVKAALLETLSNREFPDGRRGVFHPDNFTFGQPVFLSPIYAAAQSVPGVSSVHITSFQRQGVAESSALEAGRLTLDRLEIARLDNDPNFAERGLFRLNVGGGK